MEICAKLDFLLMRINQLFNFIHLSLKTSSFKHFVENYFMILETAFLTSRKHLKKLCCVSSINGASAQACYTTTSVILIIAERNFLFIVEPTQ